MNVTRAISAWRSASMNVFLHVCRITFANQCEHDFPVQSISHAFTCIVTVAPISCWDGSNGLDIVSPLVSNELLTCEYLLVQLVQEALKILKI